jgi:hypothetical protein
VAKTFHEYEFPEDHSVHWHTLSEELRDAARTTHVLAEVTCAGCRDWAVKEAAAAKRQN